MIREEVIQHFRNIISFFVNSSVSSWRQSHRQTVNQLLTVSSYLKLAYESPDNDSFNILGCALVLLLILLF